MSVTETLSNAGFGFKYITDIASPTVSCRTNVKTKKKQEHDSVWRRSWRRQKKPYTMGTEVPAQKGVSPSIFIAKVADYRPQRGN
ncbi:hypothetical protein [Shimia sp.]|uniref:hypothetical protein n=1 Tax=Shimia sp. TaxID=1954381 RepID=UPI00329806F6